MPTPASSTVSPTQSVSPTPTGVASRPSTAGPTSTGTGTSLSLRYRHGLRRGRGAAVLHRAPSAAADTITSPPTPPDGARCHVGRARTIPAAPVRPARQQASTSSAAHWGDPVGGYGIENVAGTPVYRPRQGLHRRRRLGLGRLRQHQPQLVDTRLRTVEAVRSGVGWLVDRGTARPSACGTATDFDTDAVGGGCEDRPSSQSTCQKVTPWMCSSSPASQ